MVVRRLVMALLSYLLLSTLSSAQAGKEPDSMFATPRYFVVSREYVKPGKDLPYNEIETDAARICARMGCPNAYLAINSITGPTQVWWLTPFESYTHLESMASGYAANPALLTELARIVERKADLITPPELSYAEYREDLSHASGPDLPHAKYVSITTISVAPGHQEEFEQLRKIEKSAHERAGVADSHLVYQLVSGTSDQEFLVITPLVALSDLDRMRDRHGPKYQAAISASGRADMRRLTAAAVVKSATYLFTPKPAWSHLPKEWIAVDPQFWGAAAVKEK